MDPIDDPFGEDLVESIVPVSDPASVLSEEPSAVAEIVPEVTPEPAVAAPVTEEPEASGETIIPRGGPVMGGKREPIPAANPLPAWRSTEYQDQGDVEMEHIDYHDLNDVNKDLLRLRLRLHRARKGLRAAAREATEAKLAYHRSLRRAMVQQTGGSADQRKAQAELLCEDLEADMVMKAQIVDEYSNLFRTIRDDVENAKTVAYNLRALMNIL